MNPSLSSSAFWVVTDMKMRGFTLLEVLVAISIFSVLGLGAHQMLKTVADTHDRVRTSVDGYTRLSLALSIIQRDFNQFAPRQIRDEYGEPIAPLVFDNEDYLVEFTRGGWTNPAGRQRSELQRVAYSLDYDEEQLFRHFWPVLDRAEDSEPVTQLLLEGVTDFRIAGFTADELDDQGDFDLGEIGGATPLAIELVVSTVALGDVERLFQLVEPMPQVAGSRQPGQSPDGSDGSDSPDDDDTSPDDDSAEEVN